MLFFVHVPKTAGTSFRQAAMDHFGRAYCHFDYGAASGQTSPLVKRFMYAEPDRWHLQCALREAGARLLGGHVHASRYAPLVPAARVVSFVREPQQQVMSHFEQQRRDHGYTGGLADFLHDPRGPGAQTRLLAALPLEAIGFVGLTERYEQSLEAFNATFGTTLDARRVNANPRRGDAAAPAPYEVPEPLRATMAERTQADAALHRRAGALLDARLQALAAGRPYVHGAITSAAPGHVAGFAYTVQGDEPVRVQLFVDGRDAAEADATEDRPALRALGVPRNGFVGFDFRPVPPLAPGARVRVGVKAGGQMLGEMEVAPPRAGPRPAAA